MSLKVESYNPNFIQTFRESISSSSIDCEIYDIKYKLCSNNHLISDTSEECYFCSKTKCCSNIGEEMIRKKFENMFNNRFPRSYPSWSAFPGSNKHPLEYYLLHGYNDKYQIAFIYGDSNKQIVNNIQNLCKEKNIDLIVIPYKSSFNKLKKYIDNEISKLLNKRQDINTLKF